MSEHRTPAEITFDAAVTEQFNSIERGGAFDFVLEFDEIEWLDFVIGWVEQQRAMGPLTSAHRATTIALLRYWRRGTGGGS